MPSWLGTLNYKSLFFSGLSEQSKPAGALSECQMRFDVSFDRHIQPGDQLIGRSGEQQTSEVSKLFPGHRAA
jgi:hypothetical protein